MKRIPGPKPRREDRTSDSGRLFGIHPLIEALKSGRGLERIYIARGRGGRPVDELIALARSRGVPLHFEPRELLDRIIGHPKHQGVMGLVGAKAYSDIESILEEASRRGEPPALLILDGIEDPRNLGAILRTAEAAGLHGVVIPDRRSAGLNETVARASAGAIEHIAVARVGNLTRAIEGLKSKGIWIYGLDAGADKSYLAIDYRTPLALVAGSEGRGVRPGVLTVCDERVRIPMRGRVASLNVSVAVGVVAFEMMRQRTG